MTGKTEPVATAWKARYVFPVEGPPIRDGVVTVAGERIVAVGNRAASSIHDLGNAAILPGLVNAHTHLEFSGLDRPLGTPGVSLPDWIRQVIAFRRGGATDTVNAVRRGLQECLRCGTTTLGEIASPGWSAGPFEEAGLDATVFLELIGLSADRVTPLMELASAQVKGAGGRGQGSGIGGIEHVAWRPGLSPHAPYTVHPKLLRQTAALSRTANIPLAMHLAESRDEVELLRSGGGPFVDLLKEFSVWTPEAIPHGTRPLDYLRVLRSAFRALVIHGNYLDHEETAFLANEADRLALVHCPRTHAFFQHAPFPLARLLAAGVAVSLGTDSRASNPDLSLLEEMRLLARIHQDVPSRVILELGTIRGARALGREADVGSLRPGKLANLAIVALPERDEPDPHDLVLRSSGPVVGVVRRGA
ncbi:MAG: amidohydrolase family protein [Pirellulales bacterium]